MGELLRTLWNPQPLRTTMPLRSIDARTGLAEGPVIADSTTEDIDAAVAAAAAAKDSFAATPVTSRARLLRAIAEGLESRRAELVPLADRETALGVARLDGELDRTTYQLRGFADLIERDGSTPFLDDPAVAGKPPAGRPHLTRVATPVGPVANFAASNFPFAFSVAGGDTASALAAGCPVVVKAHPGHPALSRLTAQAVTKAVEDCRLPQGVFQMVSGASADVGVRLVQAPSTAAVTFTGSFRGGTALAKLAADRPQPIPFYGELGSINPVVVLPSVAESQLDVLASELAASICLGTGQFCTSPGVVILLDGVAGDRFASALANALTGRTLHPMLTASIRGTFDRGLQGWRNSRTARVLVDGVGDTGCGAQSPHPFLAEVGASEFIAHPEWREEVFGPAALVVRVRSTADAVSVLGAIGGALTATIWGVPDGEDPPNEDSVDVIRAAMQIAGRVLFKGVPTGVAISAAQHHGGPYPASTAPFTTSVGFAAIERFTRPVALQDAPPWLVNRRGLMV